MNHFQPQDKHLEKSIQFVIIGKVRRVVREVECAASVIFGKDLPTEVAMKFFDFYEYIIESSIDGLSSLFARFFFRDKKFYACMDVVCSIDLTEYQSEDIFVDKTDDDCYTLSCSMEGGDVS